MTDAFDKTLVISADSFFLLPDTETITYFPVSGASRQIKAVVDRPGPEALGDLSGGQRENIEILVKNNGTDGIASTDVDTGGDKVQIGIRGNRRPIMMRITEILGQDAGMMKLKVI